MPFPRRQLSGEASIAASDRSTAFVPRALFATFVYGAPIYLTLLFGADQAPPDRPFGSNEPSEPDLPPADGIKLDVEQLIHEIGEFLRATRHASAAEGIDADRRCL